MFARQKLPDLNNLIFKIGVSDRNSALIKAQMAIKDITRQEAKRTDDAPQVPTSFRDNINITKPNPNKATTDNFIGVRDACNAGHGITK